MAKSRDEATPKRAEPVARDGPYVMMLVLTLIAIAAGCLFMYLDTDEYAGKPVPKEPAPAPKKLGEFFKEDAAATAPAPPAGGAADPGGMPPGMPPGM